MNYNLSELLEEANKFLTMFYPYTSYSNQTQIEELVSKLETIIQNENMKTVKIVDSENTLQKLKDFHGLTDEAVEELQTEIILSEGLSVNIKGDGSELKTYYIYETDEGNPTKLELYEAQEILVVLDNNELLQAINSIPMQNKDYDNKSIVTRVSPSQLINQRQLPRGSVYCYIEPWEMNELEWLEF